MDEHQAIQRLKKGDIGGLEFLVMSHQKKAMRTAFLITRDAGLAEDVVQDSFLQAYRAIGGFDETRPFEPWFLRSVVNASVKAMQKSAKQAEAWDDADESIFVDLVERVEPQVESIEFQNQIWEAMQKLSPRQRAVIVQRYFLEMSENEMARESGSAIGTVKWTLNVARERLRILLGRSER
jgi:RNA polymerase sigma-70 factor (ECF subfamily)